MLHKYNPHAFSLILIVLCGVLVLKANAQNVGIGTTAPRVKFEILDGHALFDGTPAAAYPDLGAGRRLQWDQNLGAMRIGTVTGVLWNTAFSGENSFAGGLDVSARAAQSFAWGTNTNAIGARSIAIGDDQLTVLTGSVAIGRQTQNISDSAMVFNTGGPSVYASFFEPRTLALVTGSTQPSLYVQASTSAGNPGNVGIGGKVADEQLTVTGNARVRDTLKTNRLQVQQGPVNPGDVLMASDTDGNAEWQPSPISPNTYWNRTGNSGTLPKTVKGHGVNFLGTIDDKSLSFGTYDTVRMALSTSGELTLSAFNSAFPTANVGIAIRTDQEDVSPNIEYGGSVIIGEDAGMNSLAGGQIAIGYNALNTHLNGTYNSAIGIYSYATLVDGLANVAYGVNSGIHLREGNYNTFIGPLSGNLIRFGNYNTCIGTNAAGDNNSASFSANFNTIVGTSSSISSGVDNAVVLGAFKEAAHSGAFVTGDANGVFTSSAANRFHTRFAGGYELFTDAPATLGVSVPAGGNSWASISDSTLKTNYLPANAELLLSRLDGLKLGTWNYKSQPRTRRHYGPMAQEFFAAYGRDFYGSIGNSTTLQSADVDGVLLILIKGLKDRNEALNDRMKNLQLENETLKTRLDRLEKAIEKLGKR